MDSHTSQGSSSNEEVESNMMRAKIERLEEKNKMLEDALEKQTRRIDEILGHIGERGNKVFCETDETDEQVKTLERRVELIPSMEDIKKWTCEYVERELDDIHPLKDRWETTGYLPDYGGCVGYFYCPPRTPSSIARKNAQIHYNRSEIMKEMEIKLSD